MGEEGREREEEEGGSKGGREKGRNGEAYVVPS